VRDSRARDRRRNDRRGPCLRRTTPCRFRLIP
jgi:hypothetical protein